MYIYIYYITQQVMSYWPLSIVTNCQLSRTVKCHAGVNTDIYHIHVYIIYDRHIIYI